jgi:hypothetical protein
MHLLNKGLFLNMGLGLLLLVGISAVVSLIRLHGETANSFKLRTFIFIIAAFAVYGCWVFTIPVFLVMAYRSFRAGKQAPKGLSGLASGKFGSHSNAKGWIAGLGILIWKILCLLPDGKPNDDKYYFDGNGEPYAYAQSDQFLDARDGW